MINTNNLQKIKILADKIEYTVTKTVKEARISSVYDQSAYDMYNEDLVYLYSEIKKDVVAVYNSNTRDYSNLFTDKRRGQVCEAIDLSRIKGLTKKEKSCIDQVIVDDNCTGSSYYSNPQDYLYFDWIDTPSKEVQDTISKKIKASLLVETVKAAGYSQGEWEYYTIVSYNTIDTSETSSYSNLIDNLKYFFRVQEYYVSLVDIETRLYTSGIEEVEEVEQDSYGVVTYSGTIEKEQLTDLETKGYTIIQ